MRFSDLKKGDVFQLEGGLYEVATLGERIVIAYVLGQTVHDEYLRTYDPKDLAGTEYLTTAFSDMRFEREHLTDEERQYDTDTKALL